MRSKQQIRERSRHASPRGLRAPGSNSLLGRRLLGSLRLFVDLTAWFVAMALGALGLGASPIHAITAGAVAALTHLAIGLGVGLYRGRWRLASFDEAAALAGVTTLVTIALGILRLIASRNDVTLAFSVLAPFAALSGMLLARGVRRNSMERSQRPADKDVLPVIVFGAGDGGAQTIRAMLGNPQSRYRPVALLDDDPAKRNLRIQGVPVRGTRAQLASVVRKTDSRLLVVAIPSADAAIMRTLNEQAEKLGVDVRVLPPTHELVEGTVSLSDIREITEADLLGRRAIDTDVDAIAEYLTGKRVLVTGAGGSIGSELCRQIARFAPARLVMLDRDESALHALQLALEGRALLESRNVVVADIRDGARLAEVFDEHTPDVVFHAAALKHLPLLELYPEEGWKTNVEGTNNVLRASARVGVTHFVNVSTDKAADPTSVLGYTKRIAEQLTAWYANRTRGDWVSVRFGNVLGSRGSMLLTFRAQVAAGGPITVTDPGVTRFFMTPSEACQLVVQAAAVGHRGEVLVLDMGEPVKILDVAKRLAAAAPTHVDIVFTGLRNGEKLHESLVSESEIDVRRAHPLISHVPVPALTPSRLGLFDRSSGPAARASMAQMCVADIDEEIRLVA